MDLHFDADNVVVGYAYRIREDLFLNESHFLLL